MVAGRTSDAYAAQVSQGNSRRLRFAPWRLRLAGLAGALVMGWAVHATLTATDTVKLTPLTISVTPAAGLPPEVQALEANTVRQAFDRATTTEFTAFGESRIEASFELAREVRALKLYGPAPYRLSVAARVGSDWQGLAALSDLDLSALSVAWHSFALSTPVSTTALQFTLTPLGGSTASGMAEIEIWGEGQRVTVADGRALLAALTGGAAPVHGRRYDATPAEGVIGPLTGATPDDPSDNTFTVNLERAPLDFKRAWLTYEAHGLAHWSGAVRAINAHPAQGGLSMTATEVWATQVEPINPAWLVAGANTVSFSVPAGVVVPYTVRNVRLIAELENGANFVAAVTSNRSDDNNPAAGAYDGDFTSGWQPYPAGTPLRAADPTLALGFDKPSQLDGLVLYVNNRLQGKVEVDVRTGEAWQSTGVSVKARDWITGWNTLAVTTATPVDGVRLTFSGGRGSAGEIRELMAVGSGVGPSVHPPAITVSYPDAGQYWGRSAYVRGFVTVADNGSGPAQLIVGASPVAHTDGAFGVLVNKDDVGFAEQGDDAPWSVKIKAIYPDDTIVSTTVALTTPGALANGDVEEVLSPYNIGVPPGQDKKISYDQAELDIDANAVNQAFTLGITPLKNKDLPTLDPGMTNVTKGPRKGYRFTPHGHKFNKKIKITLPYSEVFIPVGHQAADIQSYYFDEELGRWVALERVAVDEVKQTITSLTDHFTDMINATVTVPEHPQAQHFNPTQIKDIKAADPGAQINLIEPPQANNMGDARLSYPIEIPPGRNGLQPQLAMQYNSTGQNGWLGLGWGLPMRAITIDTRWGVPRYDTGQLDPARGPLETETYMLEGQQLTPVAHRGELKLRTADTTVINGETVKVFHTRVEGQFRQIIRHGTDPTNYWWEVTDKNGTQYFYGGGPETGGPTAGSTLDDKFDQPSVQGNIAVWSLREVRDTNGNSIKYTCERVIDKGLPNGKVDGVELYLKAITYTREAGQAEGPYTVKFFRDSDPEIDAPRRPDVMIDARNGFKKVTAERLRRIDVEFDNKVIRRYDLRYTEEAFRKTLLHSITQYGEDGTPFPGTVTGPDGKTYPFNTHFFTYYDEVRPDGTNYAGFSGTFPWQTGHDDLGKDFFAFDAEISALGGTDGDSVGGDVYLGFGPYPRKDISVGRKHGRSRSRNAGLVAMVDLNGDSLPDKVFDCDVARSGATQQACAGAPFAYRPNTSGPNADPSQITFGDPVRLTSLPAISRERTRVSSRGTEAYFGGSVIDNNADTLVTQSAYFTDVNGDGLTDVVKDNVTFFNYLDNGVPTFTTNSSLTPRPIDQNQGIIGDGTLPNFDDLQQQLINENPLMDAVRRWVAPYDGTVAVSGTVQLIEDPSQERQDYATADGVRLAVQKNNKEVWAARIQALDYAEHNPLDLPNIAPEPGDLTGIAVQRGDRLYFRVQSVFDGAFDDVAWNPQIQYVGPPLSQTDVNDLPVYQYAAGDDFIYGGRFVPVRLPFKGKVRIDGDLNKPAVTTDDVTLAVYLLSFAEFQALGDVTQIPVLKTPIIERTLKAGDTGTIAFVPETDDISVNRDDFMLLLARVDSNIDLSKIQWTPQAFYVEAFAPDEQPTDNDGNPPTDENGDPIDIGVEPGAPLPVTDPDGNYTIQLNPIYDIDFYPANVLSAPQTGWTAPEGGQVLVIPRITPRLVAGERIFDFDSEAAATAKRRVAKLGKNVIDIINGTRYAPAAHSFEIAVTAGEEIFFDFASRDAGLNAKIDGVSMQVHFIKPTLTQPIADIPLSKDDQPLPPAQTWTVGQSGTATITPDLALDSGQPFDFDGRLTFHVGHSFTDGQGDPATKSYTRKITLTAGETFDPAPYAFDVPVTAGDQLAFYYTTAQDDLLTKPLVRAALVRITPAAVLIDVPTALHRTTIPNAFARDYRGWGYVGVNGNTSCTQKEALGDTDPCTEPPIDEAKLVVSTDPNDYILTDPNDTPENRDVYVAAPEAANNRWVSEDDLWQIKAGAMSASRRGIDQIIVPTPDDYNAALAVPRITQSDQSTIGGGFYVSISDADSDSDALLDYMDLNGDRHPDIVSAQGIVQYTRATGAYEPSQSAVNLGGFRNTENDGLTLGPGGTIPDLPTIAKNHAKSMNKETPAKPQAQSPSFGFSGSLGENENAGKYMLLDVNGDGLPDRVRQSGGQLVARLNLGYRFTDVEEPWGAANLGEGESLNASIGASLGISGYSDTVRGFSGGVNLGASLSETKKILADMNGDGLIDYLFNSDGSLFVAFNTGNGYATPVKWSGDKDLGDGKSVSLGAGGSVVITIGPLCLPTPLCYIIINPAASGSLSVSRTENSFQDVDGDGYADYLSSEKDDNIDVQVNQTGRTNLLESVIRPMGATIDLEYTRSGNTFAQPQSRWVLSKSTVFDGLAGDYQASHPGADYQVTTYAYEGGFHNRNEREFYGYAKVEETVLDTTGISAAGDLGTATLYRRITREFRTDNYYVKGLLIRELTDDLSEPGQVRPFLETRNTYLLRDIDTGNEVVNPNSTTATVFPELTRTDRLFYEGDPGTIKSTYTTNKYDAVGNITEFFDVGETSGTNPDRDNVKALITYTGDPSGRHAGCLDNSSGRYIVGKADSITVTDNLGKELRRREADFDCTGGTANLTEVRQYLANGGTAVASLDYEPNGNLKQVIGPENLKSERYTLDYTYDDVVKTYVTRIRDSFGYESQATHDYRWGKVETTTDLNGNTIDYDYDIYGRTIVITGPYELENNHEFTFRFDYHPERDVPYALTQHLDPERDVADPIETILLTDGVKRVLQTKKDGSIHVGEAATAQDVMMVSGRVTFDHVGRTIWQYYPDVEPKGAVDHTEFNIGYDPDGVQPTEMDYDILDRNTLTRIPDNTATTIKYTIGDDRNGQDRFLTTVIDTNTNETITYRDVRDLTTAVQEFNDTKGEVLWTEYEYDPLKQIEKVIDDGGNITEVRYDNFGRRTVIDNPDTGRVQTVYDLASNVIQMITANLKQGNKAIDYDYEFNRLISITYPDFPENNVSYEYGDALPPGQKDEFNRVGRITTVTDESGVKEQLYGKLGETIKEIKTLASDTQGNSPNSPEVYTTEYFYDTWARLHEMTYPDGEVLKYSYDSGGLPQAVHGTKAGAQFPYITRLEYDKFEQRQFVLAGNGIKTQYTYDPLDRRLCGLKTGASFAASTGCPAPTSPDAVPETPGAFQALAYQYDDVGNITALQNQVAVTPPSAFGGPTTQTFTYDALYRLTGATGRFDYAPGKADTYELAMDYNTIHNIRSKKQDHFRGKLGGKAIPQKKTSYDWTYEYKRPQPHAPSQIGNREFFYDANGNQTGFQSLKSGTRRTIVWDEENRIQSIADNGRTTTYKYDDQGERVIKRGPQGETAYINQYWTVRNRSVGTKHIYVGTSRMVSKLSPGEAHINPGGGGRGQGTATNTGANTNNGNGRGTPDWQDRFGEILGRWLEHRSEVANSHAMNTEKNPHYAGSPPGKMPPLLPEGNFVYFYHSDHLGSTGYVTDHEGALYEHIQYFPFGETWVQEHSNTQRTPYLFTGKELDEETGLYYYGARYYDPRTSVWESVDPILGSYLGGRPNGGVFSPSNLAFYSYVGLNPQKYIDPTGMAKICADDGEGNSSCVYVDANADGNSKDDDLSKSQIAMFSTAYNEFILNNNDRDIGRMGTSVTGGTKVDRENVRVASQFVGANLEGGWGNTRIEIASKYYVGQYAIPVDAGAMSQVTRGDKVSYILYINVKNANHRTNPSSLARTLTHESLHRGKGQFIRGMRQSHRRLDDNAKALIKQWGLAGSGCPAYGSRTGFMGWWGPQFYSGC